MPNIVKTKYMDVPSANYTEYFCIDDNARKQIKPVAGDRAVMKNGEIYFCWEPGIWALIDNNREPGYKLPIASKEMLGGVKIGEGLNIDPNSGILSKSEVWENIDLSSTGLFDSVLDPLTGTIVNTLKANTSLFDLPLGKNFKKVRITVLSRITTEPSYSPNTMVALKPVDPNSESLANVDFIISIGSENTATIYNNGLMETIFEITKTNVNDSVNLFECRTYVNGNYAKFDSTPIPNIVHDFIMAGSMYSKSYKEKSFNLDRVCFASSSTTNNIVSAGSTFRIEGVAE